MQIVSKTIFLKNNKILLEKRKKDEDNYAGVWAIPGGHKKNKESIKKTEKREMKEELHISPINPKFFGEFKDIDPTSKKAYKHEVFLCTKYKGKVTKTFEEEKIKWFSLARINQIKKLSKIDKKILNQLRGGLACQKK